MWRRCGAGMLIRIDRSTQIAYVRSTGGLPMRLILAFVLLGATCMGSHYHRGQDSECPGPNCECAATNGCVCRAGATCTWQGTNCEPLPAGNCFFTCPQKNICIGTCGSECSQACKGGSSCTLSTGSDANVTCDNATCTISVGDDSNVVCTNQAVCHITCGQSCDVECRGAKCDLKCGQGDSPDPVEGGWTCRESG